MSTINLATAQPFFSAITQIYDARFPKQRIPAMVPPHKNNPDANHLIAIDRYNRTPTMDSWYQAVDATDLLDDESLKNKGRSIEKVAMQRSALVHMEMMGEKAQHILPNGILNNCPNSFLPFFYSLASPKSQLDSLIFRKVYCSATPEERARIVKTMEAACANLKPNFFTSDRLIYRIQGVVAYVFSSKVVKVTVFIAVIYISKKMFDSSVEKVSQLVVTDVLPRWENLLKVNAHMYVAQGVAKVYGMCISLNASYAAQSSMKQFFISGGIALSSFSLRQLSSTASRMTGIANVIISPKGCLYSFYSFLPPSASMIQSVLLTFKICSGTEYQTEKAIRQQFKDQPECCEKGLKAHALWMRLMRKGRPEETFVGLLLNPSID